MDKKERIKLFKKIVIAANELIAETKSQLESEKPELRHGAFGKYPQSSTYWIMLKRNGELEIFGDCSGAGLSVDESYEEDYVPEGYFFDDLAAMSEPLEKFEVESGCFSFRAVLNKKNGRINMNTQGAWMNIETMHEIILNLRRMEATLKKEQAEKKK